MFRVEAQQIALYNHSEDEQKDEAFDDFAVNGAFVRIVFKLQHPSSHCHRLSDCRHHTVALQLPLAADRHSPAITDLLDTDDLPGRLHSGRKLCREGGQAGTGAFPRRSVLE